MIGSSFSLSVAIEMDLSNLRSEEADSEVMKRVRIDDELSDAAARISC